MNLLTTFLLTLNIETVRFLSGLQCDMNSEDDSKGMGSPSVLWRRLLGAKALAVIGLLLILSGGLAFLNALGLGGGYFPAALVAFGTVLLLVGFLKGMFKI